MVKLIRKCIFGQVKGKKMNGRPRVKVLDLPEINIANKSYTELKKSALHKIGRSGGFEVGPVGGQGV